ncbi:MAG TPA: hypothetical protein DHV26_05815 [Cytophagales bacterium]|jgi:quercetin dioxygenase-like cupin family protein|nr:hypothetical protein [Cytophagales bacterium]HRG10096.1 hypothetical protein [Cyclobacteriaceae bacterium]
MDILNSIEFSPGKPTVLQIKKTDTIRMFCVALGKDQLLHKHQAKVPSLLLVLKGSVDFLIRGEVITLQELETYQIPVNTDHEVKGRLDQNIILITQELKSF